MIVNLFTIGFWGLFIVLNRWRKPSRVCCCMEMVVVVVVVVFVAAAVGCRLFKSSFSVCIYPASLVTVRTEVDLYVKKYVIFIVQSNPGYC